MIEYLKRPSPVLEKLSSRFILVGSVSIFIFLFLWIFQPFGLPDAYKYSAALISLGYALLTFVVFILMMGFVNPRLQSYYKERFTLGKHIGVILVSITILGLLNGAYASYVLEKSYIEDIGIQNAIVNQLFYTYAVALFPTIAVLVYFELRQRNYYVEQSGQINRSPKDSVVFAQEAEKIEVVGDSAGEQSSFYASDFLFAKAAGNYVELYYTDNGSVSKEVLRLTLSGLLNQIDKVDASIFQTHRSYVVNLQAIAKVEGNAQGYTLALLDSDEMVPVSRGKITEFNTVMNGN